MHSLPQIKDIIKSLHDIDVSERCRKRKCVFPRQLFCYVSVQIGHSRKAVARFLGFNSKTVGHNVVNVTCWLKHDESVQKSVEGIIKIVENKK